MDADLALRVIDGWVDRGDGMPVDPEALRASAALQGVVRAARAYVKGRTVGRFLELARALQEAPDVNRPHEITEAQVERFLAANDQMRITKEAATRLGLIVSPSEFRGMTSRNPGPGEAIR
jgi:hypothetical protein